MVDLLGAMMYCNFILMYFGLYLLVFVNACSKTFLNVGQFSKKIFSRANSLINKF